MLFGNICNINSFQPTLTNTKGTHTGCLLLLNLYIIGTEHYLLTAIATKHYLLIAQRKNALGLRILQKDAGLVLMS